VADYFWLLVPFATVGAGFLWWFVASRAPAVNQGLMLASEFLTGTVSETATTGVRGDRPMRFWMVTRSLPPYRGRWTEIDCELPAGTAAGVALHLRREGDGDSRKLVDIVVGDPPFDSGFTVQGAPSSLVRAALDPDLRAKLLALPRCEVEFPSYQSSDAPPRLRLGLQGWPQQRESIQAAIDLVLQLAQRLCSAVIDADRDSPLQQVGSPYRAQLDSSARDAAQKARREELAALARLRTAPGGALSVLRLIAWALLIMLVLGAARALTK